MSDANAHDVGAPRALIYVIDDDPETRAMIATTLRGAGYRVQTSSSEAAALDQLHDAPRPSLIVLGRLPRRSEWAARRTAQGSSALAEAPTLAVRQAAALDADAFLPAPFGARDLLRTVELFLEVAAEIALGAQVAVVDVGAVLEVSLQLAARELAERAHVTCEFDRQLRVRANPEQLCLIFLNLLLNAAARLEQGRPAANGIRVAGWRTIEGRTIIEISDTGSELAPGRAEGASTSGIHRHVRVGQGLSLARSQHIVKAGGGSITSTSKAGNGSSFRVELPTAELA